MSATAVEPEYSTCTTCGAELEPDQEWCLECGRARTVIHPPPDWRLPVILVGGIILAALVAFAIALINLDNVGNGDGAGAIRASTPPAATQTTSAQPTGSRPGTTAGEQSAIGSWPAGLSGWTVVLATDSDRLTAMSSARQLSAGGLAVGVLDTSQHPHLTPGEWMVFSGRYPDAAQAHATAAKLVAAGHPAAVAVEVAPPGGI